MYQRPKYKTWNTESDRRKQAIHYLIWCGKELSEKDSLCPRIKTSINKWEFLKLKSSVQEKTIKKVKRKSTKWEGILAKYIPDIVLISRIYKKLKKKELKNQCIEFSKS